MRRAPFLKRAAPLLCVLCLDVALEAGSPATALDIGEAAKVVYNVYGDNLNRRMREGETLIQNQKVQTGVDSAAQLVFLDDTKLVIGARSEVKLDDFIYQPDTSLTKGKLDLVRGVLRFVSANATRVDLSIKTQVAVLGVRGTVFDVLASSRQTEVAVHEGTVQVDSAFGTAVVNAGEVLTVTAGGAPTRSNRVSLEMQAAVTKMFALLAPKGVSDEETQRTQVQDEETAIEPQLARIPSGTDDEFSHAIRGKDLENLIYLDLSYGRMVIEMRPDLAPLHVARLKELIREGFYDGLAFHNVVPTFVAETGDPTGTGLGGSGVKLPAEISSERFVRGTLGMKHDIGAPDSADSQFFIILEPAPHLDGKYTIWGRVIYGMELTNSIRRGQPPRTPDTVLKLRVAADVTD